MKQIDKNLEAQSFAVMKKSKPPRVSTATAKSLTTQHVLPTEM